MNQDQERSKMACSRDEQHFMDRGSTDGGSEYMFSASTGGGPTHSASTTSGGHNNIGGVITSGGGAPCGACKFLRRKCVKGCIFAPHFAAEHGAARFAAVHKIFGASNVNKLLQGLTANQRFDAVITISYEAQARIADPVYGCVGAIAQLQQQVVSLQSELSYVKAQLASCMEQLHACMVVAQHTNGIGNGGPSTTTSLPPFINIEQAHGFDPQLLLASASTPIVPYYNRELKEEFGEVPLEGTPHVCDSISLGSTPSSSMAINQVQPMHHDQHQHHVFDLLNSKNNHDMPSQHSVLRDEIEIHPLIQARCLNLHEEN